MQPASLEAVLAGVVKPITASDPRPSAIDKHPLTGAVWVGRLGIRGDEQADREVHGGLDKAVHHYPFDHYPAWRQDLPTAHQRLSAHGAFGENFSSLGWTEDTVCLGDVVAAGEARLEISHGRQPCWKLNSRFETPDMVLRVTQSKRCGWYYRVLEEGQVQAGAPLEILERPHPEWTIARLFAVLFVEAPAADLLHGLLELGVLADAWKERANKRLRRAPE